MKKDSIIGIISEDGFNKEIEDALAQAEQGIIPETPVECIYFRDLETFQIYVTPERLVLLDALRKSGPMRIRELAKLLHRHNEELNSDVKILLRIGLIEKDKRGFYFAPW